MEWAYYTNLNWLRSAERGASNVGGDSSAYGAGVAAEGSVFPAISGIRSGVAVVTRTAVTASTTPATASSIAAERRSLPVLTSSPSAGFTRNQLWASVANTPERIASSKRSVRP